MRKLALALGIALAAAAPLAADATFHHRGTATIDGIEDPGEWTGAEAGTAQLTLPPGLGGGSYPVTLLVMNDDSNLYIAIRLPYGSSPPYPSYTTLSTGAYRGDQDPCAPATVIDERDLRSMEDSLYYDDMFAEHLAGCDLQHGNVDLLAGGTLDGAGAFTTDGSTTFFEDSQPLDTADDSYDLSAALRDRVEFSASAGGCDPVGCGTPAGFARRVFLEPANLVFLGDFESGYTSDWSATVP